MMISVYDEVGAFILNYELDEGETADVPAAGGYVEGEIDGDLYYMVSGVVTARPSIVSEVDYTIDANGTDSVTIALPNGTTVRHDGATLVSSGSENFVVRSSILGEWAFEIIPPFPYIEVEVRVTALAI